MSKKLIEKESFLAAMLLLGYERVKLSDIRLFIEMFELKNPSFNSIDSLYVKLQNYINIDQRDTVTIKSEYKMDSYLTENNTTLNALLKKVAGPILLDYIANFDMEEFVLRKMNFFAGVRVDSLDRYFVKKEQDILKQLDEKGFLTTRYNDDVIYDDYKELSLSDYRKVEYFKKDNKEEVDSFVGKLNAMRYDVGLLDDYLLKQDLEQHPSQILTIDGLNEFCLTYDRCNLAPGASPLFFTRLKNKRGSIFDEEGKKMMEDMLSVIDDGHCIYVCHPNHIFAGDKPINGEVKRMLNVNWNDIDVSRLFRVGDYGTFVLPEATEAFKYIHAKLGNAIMKQVKEGHKDTALSYLAVVEKYRFDAEEFYMIRGIIQGDYEGYSLAFNPEFQKTIPQSVWDRSLRFSGREVPEAFLVKRQK